MGIRSNEKKIHKRPLSAKEFKEGFDWDAGKPPSERELAHQRETEREHRAAVSRYRKARRDWFPGFDAIDVDTFWDAAINDLMQQCLLHRENPASGELWALAYHVQDALCDFQECALPAAWEDEMVCRTTAAMREIYERVLRRSDAGKGAHGRHEAAKLTPEEREIQAHEIESSLEELGYDIQQPTKRSRLLTALITSADEIRFYRTPEELADRGEYIEREGTYRGPAQAAAENVGKLWPELLQDLPLYIDGVRLRPIRPVSGRTVMEQRAAARRRSLREFEPAALAMRALDANLRNELQGELFKKVMVGCAELIEHAFEEQERREAEHHAMNSSPH